LEEHAASVFRVEDRAAHFSEMYVPFYHTTWYHIQEDSNLHVTKQLTSFVSNIQVVKTENQHNISRWKKMPHIYNMYNKGNGQISSICGINDLKTEGKN
jgi:hypothetical protein